MARPPACLEEPVVPDALVPELKPYVVVFSGGGALGAWEVGCLESLAKHHDGLPRVRAGTSAGGLNAAAITAGLSIDELADLWRSLRPKDVYAERPPGRNKLGLIGAVWWATMKHPSTAASLGGWARGAYTVASTLPSIFDSAPLERTLRAQLEHRSDIFLSSKAVTVLAATDVLRRRPHYFVHGQNAPIDAKSTWQTITGFGLLLDAVMATSAIPLLFPPRGTYVDGGVVRNQPLLAATKVRADGEPIYVLLPHADRLPDAPNLGNLGPALLDIWLGAGLEREMLLIGIKNTARAPQDKPLIPVCVIRATKNLEEMSGLLKFGTNVDKLIDAGRTDASLALSSFDASNTDTWEHDARPL